jgi:hypothetical protein
MQVFLPYADFNRSVSCLDPSRLGNQIYREGLTLIRGGWPNHPVSKAWRNYRKLLAQYCLAGLDELEKRGRKYPHHKVTFLEYFENEPDNGLPGWIGLEQFHASHRSNLLRKDPSWYGKFGWTEPPTLEYWWPTKHGF